MRRILKFLAAAAAAALPAVAGAQQVHFVGSTIGCFYIGVGHSCTPSAAFSLGALSYQGGTFDFYTDPAGPVNTPGVSYGAVGASSSADSHGGITVGGAFTSPTTPANAWFMTLQTTLNTPTVPGSNVFTSNWTITGSTAGPNIGGVRFSPINGVIYTGPFSNGQVLGCPGCTANGVVDSWDYDRQSITAGHTGFISSALVITSTTSTPEPASLALMATGVLALAGVGVIRRRDA